MQVTKEMSLDERLKDLPDKLFDDQPDDYCINHAIARNQRKREQTLCGDAGTKGYEAVGCFECEGYYYDCKKYNSNATRISNQQ
jgi:hypothetical protein